ncbi:PorT family protein [Algibacter amylolyticus]|uniref:PorT family protein n=1 Tax=Algibacter amylolyticus TaxID=1608400 RepID=A0A5M7BD61_9FLAO|nr:porin family protein [Algibacter amylolyticus]KAA5825075.1 PorT family protein [Algibacter amylolyticus]MBB5268819.1 hypothetical protein [Algibacter amylolyticus]TSJ77569.1 PorT family protein [Algibacter amylolyticus]
MRTKFITLVVTLCAIFSINAQDKHTSNTGIKLGYNLAAVSFDGETETGQRHSFQGGFYSESFLNQAVALQIELLYSQQGYELKDDGGTFTQKLDYINLPLMLKIYPINSFFLEAGPQVGYAISHKEEFDSSFGFFDTTQEFEPNSFDYGVNVGAGFKTDSGFNIGARYTHGLGEIYEDNSPQNRVLQFYLGFNF